MFWEKIFLCYTYAKNKWGELMGRYAVEDTIFDVLEDKTVLEEGYDIQDNILICEKTMKVVTRSNIYNYPDGFSLYLKFDDTGKQKLINLTLSNYKSQI